MSKRKPSAVEQYLKIDREVHADETTVQKYAQRLDNNQFALCRIAHDAVASGDYTIATFADAVGISGATIRVKVNIWERYGGSAIRFTDAYNEVTGESKRPKRSQRAIKAATAAELAEYATPAAFAEAVAQNPDLARAVARHVKASESVETETLHVRSGRVQRARDMADRIEGNLRGGAEKLGKKLGLDHSTRTLRRASSYIYGAILEAEMYGVDYPEAEEAELLAIEDALARFREARGHDRRVSDSDREFLESIGITTTNDETLTEDLK